jgi:PAS domain S-box-containing protein
MRAPAGAERRRAALNAAAPARARAGQGGASWRAALGRVTLSERQSYLLKLALVTGAYFGAAKGGLALAFANSSVTAIWAPTGLALAALVIWGHRMWPAVALGAFLANVTTDAPLGAVFGITVGNTLEALGGAYLLSRVDFRPTLARFRDVAALVALAAVLSTIISASIGIASLWAAGALSGPDIPTTWRIWWLGDMGGDLVIASLLLVLASRPRLEIRPWMAWEAALLSAALAAVCLLVFQSETTLPYTTFPLLFWIGLRFRQPGAVLAGLLIAGFAVWFTAHDQGPFAVGSPDGDLSRAQMFVGIATITALLVAAVRTEREDAVDAVAMLAEAQGLAHIGSWEWDIAADKVSWSDELHRIYGVDPESFAASYDAFIECVHPDDRQLVADSVQTAFRERSSFQFVHRIVRPDGEVRMLQAHGRVICDPSGEPALMRGTGQDVTDRRQAEERIAQQAELLDAAHDAIIVREPADSRVVYWNRAAEEIYGYSAEEADGRITHELLATDFPEALDAVDAGLAERGRWEGELRHTRRDGRRIVVSSRQALQRDDQGRPKAIIEINSDITERKRAEEARPLAAIVESSDDAIVAKDLEGRVLAWNKAAERLYGYTGAEAAGKPISMLAPEDRRDEMPEILERVGRGETVDHFETVRRTKDGRLVDVSLTVSPVRDDQGTITGASAIARDITQRKRAEQQLRLVSAELELRVVELAAANDELEAFSYSVSHDLRAPLRAMDGFSRALMEDYGDTLDEQGRGMLERVRAGSQRMGRLIDEMLTLSRLTRQELKRGRVDLSALARQIGSDLAAERSDRRVDLVVERGLVAEGDPELLEIALRNLLQNAWKFTAARSDPRIEFRRERANGRFAYVVRDNGAGFDMRYAEKLFRPFERLHSERDFPGIGVGLATVNRVVRRHGGSVWAEGLVGEGAAFFFDLPEAERE